jgi:hypothetical protein
LLKDPVDAGSPDARLLGHGGRPDALAHQRTNIKALMDAGLGASAVSKRLERRGERLPDTQTSGPTFLNLRHAVTSGINLDALRGCHRRHGVEHRLIYPRCSKLQILSPSFTRY